MKKHFPNAFIYGVDINEWCIKQCRKKDSNNDFKFYHRLSTEFLSAENFDIIFGMAVFQNSKNKRIGKQGELFYKFEEFEKEIVFLDKKLSKGGLFIIDNSNFRFLDTAVSKKYSICNCKNNEIYRKRPVFSKNNKKISNFSKQYRVYVKSKQINQKVQLS